MGGLLSEGPNPNVPSGNKYAAAVYENVKNRFEIPKITVVCLFLAMKWQVMTPKEVLYRCLVQGMIL